MKSKKFYALVLLILTAALASTAVAQSDRGSITGTIKDPNGAVVADAKVTAINTESGEIREAKTSGEGTFTIPQLVAAPYQLSVEAAGFKTATVDEVRVGVQVTRSVEITLEIGAVGESVTVTSEAAVINTDTPVQQLNVTEKQVRELPLLVGAESGGRSPLSFIFLDSSVTSVEGQTGGTTGSSGTNATNFRVAGGQGLGADILIDGAQTRRGENGTFFSEVAPGPNAFQEFTISTSQYSSEFGNSSGGVINFTIKSGGNDFHGEAYLFHINDALNSNIDRNRLLGREKPRDRQFDYGFSVSGPVFFPRFGEGTGNPFGTLRNKTFFFFNYGGYRTSQSETVDLTVPTLAMRQGDFSELLTDPYVLQFFGGPVQIFDPSQAVGQRTAIPGNRLDLYQGGALLSAIGQNFVNLFPLPNQTGPLGSTVFRNYNTTSQATARTNYYVTKLTHTITDRQLLNFSYTFRKLPSVKGGFPRFPEPFVADGVWDQEFKSYYARLQHDWTLTANLLNHFNAGFSRSDVSNRNFTFGEGTTTSLGIRPGVTQDLGLPQVGFPGYGDPATSLDPRSLQPGGSTFFSNRVRDNSVHISDFVTYIRGKHSMKFGGEVRIQQLNNAAHFDIGGRFNFRSNQTANTNDFNQGWPVASLLTGRTEFAFNSNQTIDPGLRFFSQAFFFQDDFKVTPRLTLNLGLRYDYGRPREESRGRYRAFDPDVPNPAAGGRLGAIVSADASNGGIQAEFPGFIEPDKSNFGPRFGFAYSINDRTVVRGGYGLYYAPIIYNDFGNSGFLGYNPGSVVINGGLDSFISLENFPLLPTPNPADQSVGQLDTTIDFFNENYKAGRTAQWSLDVQRELPWNFAISVGYIGSRGTRLKSNFNPVNKLPLDALKLGESLLRKRLVDVNPAERAFAAGLGFNLPADPNQIYPGFNNAGGNLSGTVAQALRPFPQYGIINNLMESEGQSTYHALKIDLQRRFSQGIQFGLSYTKARLTGDAAEDIFGGSPLNGVIQNPYDRESLRSISPSSLPNSLVFNYIIELPFGKGRRFLNQGGIVDRLVGGWQVTGIHRYRSGVALVPFIAGGQRDFLTLVGFGGNLRPNFTGADFYTSNPATGTEYRYLNPAAFSRPPDYRGAPAISLDNGMTVNPAYITFYADPTRFFGTAPPSTNELRGQPFFAEDFSLMKKTRITETTYFEIRMEVFNLFNRGRFGLPIVNIDDINGLGLSFRNGDIFQPRRIQVGGRFVF